MKKIEELETLIDEYMSMRNLAAQAKAEQDAVAGQIKKMMEDLGIERYAASNATATYKEVVSHPIDTRALKSQMPAVAEMYMDTKITRPLKIA